MTHWAAMIEYDGAITDEQSEQLVQREADYPIVTTDREINRTRISFGLEASTLRKATDEAWRVARILTAGIVTGDSTSIRIVSDKQLAEETERPTVPDLVDTKDAMAILKINNTKRFYEVRDSRDDFPTPVVTLSGDRAIYTRAEIEAFGERWAPTRKPGRPRKTPAQ